MVSFAFLLLSFDVLGTVNSFGFQPHQKPRLLVCLAFSAARPCYSQHFEHQRPQTLLLSTFVLAPRPQNHGTVSIFWLPGPRILVLPAFWVPKALVSIFKPPGPQTLGNVSESLQFSLLSLWYFFETQWLHELSFQIRWRPISLRFPLASFETNRLPLACHCNPLEYLETHWFLSVSLTTLGTLWNCSSSFQYYVDMLVFLMSTFPGTSLMLSFVGQLWVISFGGIPVATFCDTPVATSSERSNRKQHMKRTNPKGNQHKWP